MTLPKGPEPKTIFFKFWFPVALYFGIIFWVSSIPNARVPVDISNVDKFIHLAEFGPYGVLCARAVRNSLLVRPGRYFLAALILVVLTAAFDEVHQYFVPGRYMSAWDALADTAAGALGAWIYLKRKS